MATLNKICINCGKTFPFTTSEQDFYREHGYADPKRCFPCRRAYKQKIGKAPEAHANDPCFACNPKFIRGVVTDADNKCLSCGRLIEKSVRQFPVLAHHLRGGDGQAA